MENLRRFTGARNVTTRPAYPMCRNIKTLANFEPPATDDEIHASALQFVRKLSGTTRPSRANTAAFEKAVHDVTLAARTLLLSLESHAPPRDRATEVQKAKARSAKRFGRADQVVDASHQSTPPVTRATSA